MKVIKLHGSILRPNVLFNSNKFSHQLSSFTSATLKAPFALSKESYLSPIPDKRRGTLA